MRSLFLLLAIVAFPVFGQDPPAPPTPDEGIRIETPDRADAASLVRVTLKGVKMEQGTVIFWDVLNGDRILDEKNLEKLGTRLLLSDGASKSPYRIRAFGVSEGKAFATMAELWIGEAPTPPVPPPQPVVTLAQLAGKDAAALGQLYAAMLESLGKSLFVDLDHFKRTEAAALKDRGLESNGAKAEIAKRLAVASLEDLKAPLETIVKELGSTPTPVPSGKRLIVYVHETADATGDVGRLITDIRAGQVAKYIKDKGHPSPVILDDDLQSSLLTQLASELSGMTLPALFVLDDATKAVAYKQSLPKETTPVQFLEAIKKGGA